MHASPSITASLCILLVALPIAPGAQPPVFDAHRGPNPGEMTEETRIVHALNRFTFGLRPGDAEIVRNKGLDVWFESQLHPESIPNPLLESRLAEFPAMRLSPEQLIVRFPSNAIIRQVINGKAAMPDRGILRTVYQNQIARQRAKNQQKKAAETAPAAMPQPIESNSPSPRASTDSPDGSDQEKIQSAQQIIHLPPRDRVLRLAAMQQPELDGFLKSLRPPERRALLEGLTPELRETVGDLEAPERTITGELMAERLTRDIYSEAQLQEVMTDFWLNHFNVFLRKNETMPYLLVSYERDVIRPHALGNFEDLLEAVAHSPAMLLYLDQAESSGPGSIAATRARLAQARNPERKKRDLGLNENYARELMELHTLGVNGGYSQADVVQAARILTGWTVDQPQRGGGFRFDENRHEPGAKKVMGKKFKDKGEKQGRELLQFLASRPATAKLIARKLAVRFVSDNPPQSLVDRMAKTFDSTHGDIAAVMRTLYKSPEFWSEEAYRAKVKTPLEFVVSAARASNADVHEMRPLVEALRQMGMPLFGCVPPTGYKQDAADWVSTGALVNRMNFALALSAGKFPGVTPHWTAAEAGADARALEHTLEQALVAGGASEATRKAVLEQSAQASGADAVTLRPTSTVLLGRQQALLAGLLLGSPEFQRR